MNQGSHPYFKYQASVLALSESHSDMFYVAMLDIIRRFKCKYPHAVMSKLSLPRYALLSGGKRPHEPSMLPLELLERVFLVCGSKEQLVSRTISCDWCYTASRYTHCTLVFRMNADWQYWVRSPEGKKDAELYAFAMEFVSIYIAHKWHFPAWVCSVSYENWPAMPVPFFYRIFPFVESVVYHGKTCCLHNYPVVSYPQVLPPSVHFLRIVRCSLKGYSMEYLLAMCRSIQSVTLYSVYYRHIVSITWI